MRSFALAVTIALAVLSSTGCQDDQQDSPEAAQRKAECRRLEEHIFQITPRPGDSSGRGVTDPKELERLVAKVPIEDIDLCAAVTDRSVIACMQAAPSVAALRACIPARKE
ncbi:MAG TPA: hypothetical protein VFT22_39615 [Kofleriaceae bacterium]|nr:hypothetical protein [Kofleriaceae bacterium]